MDGGWIKVYRKITDNDIWSDVVAYRLFTYLLLKASHAGTKTAGIELKRGQWIRSYRQLAEDLIYKSGRGYKKYSTSTLKRAVSNLSNAGMIAVHETEYGTLYTVQNYSKYQGSEDPEENTQNDQQNLNRTLTERTPNNNKNAIMQEINSSSIGERTDSYTCYEQNIGMLTPIIAEKISYWEKDLSPEIVQRAIKEAVIQNARKWNYINSILVNWLQAGAKNLNDVERLVREYQEQKAARAGAKSNNGGTKNGTRTNQTSYAVGDTPDIFKR